jgi:hypothetical protein
LTGPGAARPTVQASDSGETSTKKQLSCLIDHRQADTTAGDRIADPDVIESERAGVDRQPDGCGAVITRGDVGDLANSGNDSREHGKYRSDRKGIGRS